MKFQSELQDRELTGTLAANLKQIFCQPLEEFTKILR